MTNNFDRIAAAVKAFGHRFDPEVIGTMRRLIGSMHDGIQIKSMPCELDCPYGNHPRQRFDVYGSKGKAPLPVLLFVHGGGFTAGDKRSSDGAPFYQNIGLWAMRHGMRAVVMTYRLAPDFKWPSGAADIAAVIEHLHQDAENLGIDANQIVLMGQSAGAVHVATYLSQQQFHLKRDAGVCAAVVLSGLFDIVSAESNAPKSAYFSDSMIEQSNQSSLPSLLESDIPIMVAVNEFDIPDFERQAILFCDAYLQHHGHLPWFCQLKGHNHLSSILALGLDGDILGLELLAFLRRHMPEHFAMPNPENFKLIPETQP